MSYFLASGSVSDIFGKVTPPPGTPSGITDAETGLVKILNVGLNVVLIFCGLYVLLNLLIAGYMYITSSGDPKRTSEANLRMTYSVVGLIIVAIVPLIAAIIGIVIFGQWDAILNPEFKKIE